jgi:AAA15 family ATPase/GTPase
MLIEFSVGNFASFKEPVTLSLIAAKIRSKYKKLDEENIIRVDDDLSLLSSVAIYGPNASGKSNLVSAASFMRNFIRSSFRETQFDESIPVERFRLNTDTDERPSLFEMVFLVDGHQYRYGFEVDARQVASEWLFYVPKLREIKLFERQGQEIFPNPSNIQAKEFRTIHALLPKINPEQPLRPNALFLSVAAQSNGPVSQKILTWFANMRFMSGLNDVSFQGFTIAMFENDENRARIIDMVHKLDVGVQDIQITHQEREKAILEVPPPMRDLLERLTITDVVKLSTQHEKFNAQGEVVGFETMDMGRHESAGTQKLFFMTGPILDTLSNGRVLWVDEMEARMHPNITQAIVTLFNSRASNPKGAQLIFTTHDTNLLSVKKLRRDQIWFLEKDRLEASRLYSLVEFKIRNDDASLEQDYINGRYGAVPHIGELQETYEVKIQ